MQPFDLMQVSRDYLNHLHQVADDPQQRSIPLPLEVLQKALGGLRAEEVTVLGGFEGHGKSALAQQIALDTARQFSQDEGEGRRLVFYHSLEMGRYQLMARFLVQELGVRLDDLMNPEHLDDEGWAKVQGRLEHLADYPLIIFDSAKQSTADLAKAVSTFHQAGDGIPRLIVVDYFHLLSDCLGGDVARLDEGITSLKDLARQAHCHVLTIMRLNRNVQRGDLPTAMNIAGSQGIAYGADNVVFVHQPKMADHSLEADWENFTYFSVTKARNGPVGVHGMMWDSLHLSFRDLDEWEQDRRHKLPRSTSRSYS